MTDNQNSSNRVSTMRSLYLVEQGASLSWQRGRFVVRKRSDQTLSVPVNQVDQILIFGNVSVTTPCLHRCLTRNIPILLASATGTCRGLVSSWGAGPPSRRIAQMEAASDEHMRLDIARSLLNAKIDNSAMLLARYGRNRDSSHFDNARKSIRAQLPSLDSAQNRSAMLGVEGAAARVYYQAWQKEFNPLWEFKGRKKRPSPDPINALLSFGYSVLYQNALSLLSARGLLAKIGFLHQIRSGHAALASDMVEPFRAPIVDSIVLKLVLNERIHPQDYKTDTVGGQSYRLPKDLIKLFLEEIESKFDSKIAFKRDMQATSYRGCIDQQISYLEQKITHEGDFHAFHLRR